MLVGRDDELREIRELLASARLGRSGGLLLTGDPGVGKSALLAEAMSHAEGMHVLRAAGREAETRVPFGGLLELVRPALSVLPELPIPQRDALAGALAMAPATGSSRFAVGAAVLGLLCRQAEHRPLLVLVDDAQWLDEPTLDALAFAVGRLADDPVAVLAGARRDQLGRALGLPERWLAGLDEEASRAMVTAVSPVPVTSDQLARLHRATGGNPLALLHFAREPDSARTVFPEGPLAAPEAVASSFAAQVSGLGPDARAVLLTAAAAGEDLRTVTTACAELGLDLTRVSDALAAAEATGLVVLAADRIEFRHPLVRSTVYAAGTPAERRRTHRAVAAGLPAHEQDRRAWHLAEAALLPDEELARELDGVSDRATDRAAHAVAALAKERAAQLSPDRERARERLVAGAEAAWLAGQIDGAERLLAEADEPGSP
ncbi:MAG TPA: AAA family ATPase, partial [Nocardioides sp.]|nr:AAA family ATPase [Nocardioides sp.]